MPRNGSLKSFPLSRQETVVNRVRHSRSVMKTVLRSRSWVIDVQRHAAVADDADAGGRPRPCSATTPRHSIEYDRHRTACNRHACACWCDPGELAYAVFHKSCDYRCRSRAACFSLRGAAKARMTLDSGGGGRRAWRVPSEPEAEARGPASTHRTAPRTHDCCYLCVTACGRRTTSVGPGACA